MARLVGVDLPRDKRIEIALTYIYGIGRTRSQKLLAVTGVDPNARVHTLGDEELVKLKAMWAQLGVPAAGVLLVDDTAVNVSGARSVGLNAELFTTGGGRLVLEEILSGYDVVGR